MSLSGGVSEHRVPLIEWALFLLVAVITLHGQWILHHENPYVFMCRGGDALGYYQWLPVAFIEHDFHRMYWTWDMQDGRWLSIYSLGVAVLQLPFFILGHIWAWAFGYPLHGFSSPYVVAQMLGVATYAGAGLVLAYRIALRYATMESALLAAISLFAATNLFYYCVHEPMMAHLYSFFLIGLFTYCTFRILDRTEEDPARAVHVALFIFSASLMVLVRQLSVFLFLLPAIMVLNSPGGTRGFLREIFKHRIALVAAGVLALVPWILQSLYWHHVLGEWIVNAYGKKGETFAFGKMVPGLVMGSVRNGWLVYTPLMIPLLLTLLVHTWRNTAPARAIMLVLVPVWLLYSAWWCWWLGQSYGYRGFVDLYPLLAIPLAWMFRSILRRSWSWRLVSTVLLVALIKLNFGLMARFSWEWSWSDEWTWQKFFEQVSNVVTG